MENATIIMPPSSGLCSILLSASEPNIHEGPEYEKIINTILMHEEKFYELLTETMSVVATSTDQVVGIYPYVMNVTSLPFHFQL